MTGSSTIIPFQSAPQPKATTAVQSCLPRSAVVANLFTSSRVCRCCNVELPLSAFQIERRVRDRRRSVCSDCTKAKLAGKHHVGKSSYKYQTKEKRIARSRLRDAVRYGKVHKPFHCERCGAETPKHLLDGHHHDYSQPLAVEWLCRSCHGIEARGDRVKLSDPIAFNAALHRETV